MKKCKQLSITLLLIAVLAMLSACGGIQSSDEDFSDASQITAQKPSESGGTFKPSESGPRKPTGSESQNPSGSESQKPSGSESQKPSGSESQKPSGSESQKPSGSESQKPSGSESQKPADDTVTMVDLASQHYSLAVAKTLVQNLGLKLEVRTQKETSDYADNVVLEQDIAAGQKVKKGTTVYVTVSKNVPKTVSVPNLLNKTEKDALKLLQDKNLVAEKSYDYSDSVESGKVIYQNCTANSSVQPGTTVKIVISKGAKPIEQQPSGGSVTLNMFTSPTEQEKATAASIVSSITSSSMGEYDKVKAIHDYLVNSITYTLNGADVHYARGAFAGKAVCQGYADAFSLLCYTAGIQAEIVSGVGDNGSGSGPESHAWNQVRINNVWYNVDVTWDDPVGAPIPNYNYFLITNAEINRNHTADNNHPAKNNCTDTRYRTQLIQEMLKNYADHTFPGQTVYRVNNVAELENAIVSNAASGKVFVVAWDNRLLTGAITDDAVKNALQRALNEKHVGYSMKGSIIDNTSFLYQVSFQ